MVAFLEKTGIEELGILRVPGSIARLKVNRVGREAGKGGGREGGEEGGRGGWRGVVFLEKTGILRVPGSIARIKVIEHFALNSLFEYYVNESIGSD